MNVNFDPLYTAYLILWIKLFYTPYKLDQTLNVILLAEEATIQGRSLFEGVTVRGRLQFKRGVY